MKKTDIAMVVLIASVSVILSFFIAKAIFGDVYNGSVKVKTIDRIETTVVEPSKEIFNDQAINPTVPINIIGSDSTVKSGS